LIDGIKPSYLLFKQSPQIGFSTLYSLILAGYHPTSKQSPTGSKGSSANVDEFKHDIFAAYSIWADV